MIKDLIKKPSASPERKSEKEKVDERRREVLAKGRKFKSPLQFAKHKLIISTIAISLITVAILFTTGWYLLFKKNDTSDLVYRVVRVLPVSVAKIDGENVRYGDYLMIYRSNMNAVEQQSGALGSSTEAEAVRTEYRRAALTEAEELTYAYKLAKDLGITVTKSDIDEAFDSHRNVGGIERSEESFLKVINDNFGLSRTEYRRMLELSLYKKKVQAAIDEKANSLSSNIEKKLTSGEKDFTKIADSLGNSIIFEATGQLTSKKNIDGGRATVASLLEKGAISDRFISTSGDGYYFVKLLDKTDAEVNYESIKIPFTEFKNKFDSLETIEEFISLEQNQ